MEVLFEVILIQFISNTVGVYSRWAFYKIIGQEKTKKYLLGERNENSSIESEEQYHNRKGNQIIANMIVGLVVFFSIFLCILKLLDVLGML